MYSIADEGVICNSKIEIQNGVMLPFLNSSLDIMAKIEPGTRSVQTYRNVKRLAEGLGVKAVKVIANKVRDEEDEKFVRSKIPEEDFLGCIHYNAEVIEADREGASPYGFSKAASDESGRSKKPLMPC